MTVTDSRGDSSAKMTTTSLSTVTSIAGTTLNNPITLSLDAIGPAVEQRQLDLDRAVLVDFDRPTSSRER